MMTKQGLDIIIVIGAGALLILLNYLGYLEALMPFIMIPIMGAYFLGQYIERQFKSKQEKRE